MAQNWLQQKTNIYSQMHTQTTATCIGFIEMSVLSHPWLKQHLLEITNQSNRNGSNVCGIYSFISVTFLLWPILGHFQPIYIFFKMSVL